MAVFGEIVLILVGLWMMLGSIVTGFAYSAFSGKFAWFFLLPFAIGTVIVYTAIKYGPITVGVA